MPRIPSGKEGKKKKRKKSRINIKAQVSWLGKFWCGGFILFSFSPTLISLASVSYSSVSVEAWHFPGNIKQSSCPFHCSSNKEWSPRKKAVCLQSMDANKSHWVMHNSHTAKMWWKGIKAFTSTVYFWRLQFGYLSDQAFSSEKRLSLLPGRFSFPSLLMRKKEAFLTSKITLWYLGLINFKWQL